MVFNAKLWIVEPPQNLMSSHAVVPGGAESTALSAVTPAVPVESSQLAAEPRSSNQGSQALLGPGISNGALEYTRYLGYCVVSK